MVNGTRDVLVTRCEFERVGYDSHAHHIYASHEVSNIRVVQNRFVDCTGDYIRFADRNSRVVIRGAGWSE